MKYCYDSSTDNDSNNMLVSENDILYYIARYTLLFLFLKYTFISCHLDILMLRLELAG